MKKLAVVLIAIAGLLSGCLVYEPGYRGGGGHEYRGYRDRDGDGVPNRHDRRPDNPRRY
jgi:hypothetical protein